PGCGRGVPATARGPGQCLVGDFPDQDVAEGEDISAAGTNQVLVHQLLGDVVEPDVSVPFRGRPSYERRLQRPDPRQAKSASVDGSQLDETPFGRQAEVESGEHGRLNSVGKRVSAGPLNDGS